MSPLDKKISELSLLARHFYNGQGSSLAERFREACKELYQLGVEDGEIIAGKLRRGDYETANGTLDKLAVSERPSNWSVFSETGMYKLSRTTYQGDGFHTVKGTL